MNIKNFLVIFLLLLSNSLSAHTINYDKVILKHWIVEKENKTVEGSFYMYKNGNVFIEDANDNIINYPLAYFSKEDQTFAMKKAEWVKELNYKLIVPHTGKVEKKSLDLAVTMATIDVVTGGIGVIMAGVDLVGGLGAGVAPDGLEPDPHDRPEGRHD